MTDDRDTEAIGRHIRAAAERVAAPPRLRERLAAPAPARVRRWRVPGAAALAAAAAAVVLLLVGGGGPSVEQVAAAALSPPTQSADGAPPYGDWEPAGAREDTVDGRRARTVIYRRGADGAHYTVVDGERLDLPGGRRVQRGGTTYALATDGDARIVAWYARGKTCILASTLSDLDTLLAFAANGF